MFKKEDLEQMTIKQLRLIDIKEVEDEGLVQNILNDKLKNLAPVVEVNRKDAPDIKTPEEEQKYQREIDERIARIKERTLSSINPNIEVGQQSVTETKVDSSIISEEKLSSVPTELSTDQADAQYPKIYCEECQSKRKGKHRKHCSKYVGD
jgi:hypothetical protein